MITLKFCRNFDWNYVGFVELETYEQFFHFYMENYDKGFIYDVKEVEKLI